MADHINRPAQDGYPSTPPRVRVEWLIATTRVALATLVNAFNFPLYLLSGGMLPAWEFFEPHMMRTAKQRSFTFRSTSGETRVAQATLGNEAGLYGAAYLPWVEQ